MVCRIFLFGFDIWPASIFHGCHSHPCIPVESCMCSRNICACLGQLYMARVSHHPTLGCFPQGLYFTSRSAWGGEATVRLRVLATPVRNTSTQRSEFWKYCPDSAQSPWTLACVCPIFLSWNRKTANCLLAYPPLVHPSLHWLNGSFVEGSCSRTLLKFCNSFPSLVRWHLSLHM